MALLSVSFLKGKEKCTGVAPFSLECLPMNVIVGCTNFCAAGESDSPPLFFFLFPLGPDGTGVNGPMQAHVRTAQLEHRGDDGRIYDIHTCTHRVKI